ncbi:MAG: STAS/SEC14 domain-containing protein [Polyangiales bacterium]
MLEILQSPEHVAAFEYSDVLTGTDYDQSMAALDERLSVHPRIGVFIDLSALRRVSGRAWVKDLMTALARRKELHNFGRVAVVTDRSWLRWITRVSGRVLPHVCVRTFTSVSRARALAWVGQRPEAAPTAESLRVLHTTRRDSYAIVVNGKVTRADLDRVAHALNDVFEKHMGLRLLARIERFRGVELSALLAPELWQLKLAGARRVERYALVGGPRWLRPYARLVSHLTPVDMRHFEAQRELDAWTWLDARPVTNDAPRVPSRVRPRRSQPRMSHAPLK